MNQTKLTKQSFSTRFLNAVERSGNKMCDPVTLFLVLCLITVVVSALLSSSGALAVHPGTGAEVTIVNLLSKAELQHMLGSIISNFQAFPSLGLVIVVMMGAGLADKTGLMTAFIKNSVMRAPKNLVTAIIVFLGINAVAVGDAGFVMLPPLAAVVFLGLGRHPLAGLYTAYASVAGGFAACMMVQMGDVLATGFTVPAAQLIDPTYNATPAMNLYFMFVSAVILVPVGVWVNNKIIEPRLGTYTGVIDESVHEKLTDVERKGLKWAGISIIIMLAVLVALSIGPNAFLADETGSVFGMTAPMMKGIVPIVTFIFFVPGLVYGMVTGVVKKDKDTVRLMGSAVSELGGFIIIAFAASQFLAFFSRSNLGLYISIKGAEFLESIGLTGIPMFISFILVACFINIFMGSASAKWAIMAPIFVPMFMIMGYDPALTQIAYRIGDSLTNTIAPTFPYMAILLGFIKKYDKDAGFGTIVANMIPYSTAFGIVWIALLVIFIMFNIPLGIGGGIYL